METSNIHIPVLSREVLSFIYLTGESVVVDCTLGTGGHSQLILEKNQPARLIGIDMDPEALTVAQERLSPFNSKCNFIKGNYKDIDVFLKQLGIQKVDLFLLDLGLSTMQLNKPERGFSIMNNGPLDMRMDNTKGKPLSEILPCLSQATIKSILQKYGEEKRAEKLSSLIFYLRHNLHYTQELKNIVEKVSGYQKSKIHPATKVFQAFRIYINDELTSLELFMSKATSLLNSKGRIIVISYHSLEDRIVKTCFRQLVKANFGQMLNKKVIKPERAEILKNRRARSAKMRVFEVF